MSQDQDTTQPLVEFTREELAALKNDSNLCNHERRTFLKCGALLSSHVVAGGSILNLLTGEEARADDTTANVARWVYSVCGYCSVGCGRYIGVNSAGRRMARSS